jgi:transposase
LHPLINLMDEKLRASGYIRMDETPLQVINSALPASSKHYMWIRVAGPPGERIILFDYDPSRGGETAMRLLEGVQGTLHTDGHYAYDEAARVLSLTHCGCLAHARRKFFEAIQALPKAERKSYTAAHEGVQRIDTLYAIERDTKSMTDAERQAVRQEKSLPLLKSLHVWATDLKSPTLGSGKLGDALQ